MFSSSSSQSSRSRRVSTPARRRGTLCRHPHHRLSSSNSSPNLSSSGRSSQDSLLWSDASSDSEAQLTPSTDAPSEKLSSSLTDNDVRNVAEIDVTQTKQSVPASTKLVTRDSGLLRQAVGDGETGTQLIQKYCCGGGCCFLNAPSTSSTSTSSTPLQQPDNDAYKSLNLKLNHVGRLTPLTNITLLSSCFVTF